MILNNLVVSNIFKIISSIKFSFFTEEKLRLLWWFLVIVVSTIFFKFNYLDTIYRGGFSIAIENYLEDVAGLEYVKVLCLMFVRNLAEVAVLLTLLYVLACKLMRIDTRIVIVISTLFFFLVGAANQLSLLNVRSLLSSDSLMVTINWMRENPDVITSYINKQNLAYFMLFLFFSFLPILVTSPLVRSALFYRLNHVISSVATLSIVASLILYFSIGLFIKANANLKPFDGYWTSVAFSFWGDSSSNPLEREIPDMEVLKSNYFDLAYQGLDDEVKQRGIYTIPVNNNKKHIVIISLETAPQKYYPIVNNPELKNFYQMSKHSIVTDMHFTNSPYTAAATYAMLTGVYVPPKGIPILYGKMSFNGLANELPEDGYTSTYIDSYYVDWHKGDVRQRAVDSYGFKRVFDRGDYDFKVESKKLSNEFDKALYAEKVSFNKIVESIDDAITDNKKSLIFVDTIMGHFKWKAGEGNEDLGSKEKIFKLADVFDELLGELLVALSERNLEDDVIIVVTGDHGLRYHEEYESLGEQDSNVAVGFNVPLMIYSPGLFKEQIVLDHVTSHVDLTPSLLELIGVDISHYFFHGENVLDSRLKQRMVFMMNQNLKPENSFYREGAFYTYNELSGELYISAYRRNSIMPENKDIAANEDIKLKQYIAKIIRDAGEAFNDSATYFLQRHKN